MLEVKADRGSACLGWELHTAEIKSLPLTGRYTLTLRLLWRGRRQATKTTHTDQYLLWTPEHPTTNKLSIVRTLYKRTTIITDPEDRALEEKHSQDTLKTSQYPQSAMDKEVKQAKKKETEQKREKKPANHIEHQTKEQRNCTRQ